MKLKKLFAGVVAAAMMLTMAVPAFAEGKEVVQDTISVSNSPVTSVTLTKTYNVTGGTTQAETFDFTLTGSSVDKSSVTAVPNIDQDATSYKVPFDALTETSTGTFTIDLSKLHITRVGVYNYIIHEVAGSTPGVTYDPQNVTMKVTAVNNDSNGIDLYVALYKNGKKINASDAFTNSYNAYQLSVTKTVKGNFADHSKYFEFTVTLTGTTGKTYAPVTVALATADADNSTAFTSIAVDGKPHTIYLKHNQTINITNLPNDVTYTVVEVGANQEGFEYTLTSENANGTMTENKAATFENKREGTVDTGVILDNAPYIAMLTFVAAGAVFMVIKKRREEE